MYQQWTCKSRWTQRLPLPLYCRSRWEGEASPTCTVLSCRKTGTCRGVQVHFIIFSLSIYYVDIMVLHMHLAHLKECRALSINSCLFTNWISTGTMTSPHPHMIMLWGWFLNSVQQCRLQLQILTYIFH